MTPSAGLKRTQQQQEARVIFAPNDAQKSTSPAYECKAYRDQKDDVTLMREVSGGTKTMRAAGEKYLPVHPMEKEAKHKQRVKIAVSFNATGRTVSGIIGKVFRRDPVPSDDMDPKILEAAENIDRRGHSLGVFMHRVGALALRDGHAWIHVDAPRAGIVGTRSEEREAGIRPYWISVKKHQAINWRYEIRGGEPVLTLFAYREGITRPDGMFGEKIVEAIRVLREARTGEGGFLIMGELWEFDKDSEDAEKKWKRTEFYPIDSANVPVVFVPSGPTDEPYMTEPPLRDLAYEQVEHYRVRSDKQKAMTFSAIAVPYVFGKEVTTETGDSKVKWGSDGIMLINDPDATGGILESQGFGLEAMGNEESKIEARMASLGLQMLVRPSGVQPQDNRTTATSDIMRASEADAAIVLFANALETATNEALQVHASYNSKKPNPGTVTFNRDFYEQLLDPQLLRVLIEMVAADQLSLETLWKIAIEGELLPEDFDSEEEKALIEKAVAGRLARAVAMIGGDGGDSGDGDGAGGAGGSEDQQGEAA